MSSAATTCPICGTAFIPPDEAEQRLYCSADCAKTAQDWEACFAYLVAQQMIPYDDFRALLHEPHLRDLARQVVWRQGELEFMVCEDYTFATVEYRAVTLTSTGDIQAVRKPLAAWQEVFWEYAIIPLDLRLLRATRQLFGEIQSAWLLQQALYCLVPEVRSYVAHNPAATAEMLTRLAQDGASEVRRRAAAHRNTPPLLLTRLAHDENIHVRAALLEQPHLPVAILEKLVQDPEPYLHQTTANYKYPLPAPILLRLSRANDERTLLRLVVRPDLTAEILDHLSHHPYEQVRQAVAQHPACVAATLQRLAVDDFAMIRQAVAENPHCPPEVLSHLMQDGYSKVRQAVGKHPACPEPVLRRLALDGDAPVRKGVAENPHCPPDVLHELVTDDYAIVRKAIAENPQTLSVTLSQLIHDLVSEIGETAAQHPHLPTEAMYHAALSATSQVHLLRALAKNPNLPPEVFMLLADHYAAEVRYSVAYNPSAPPSVLALLALDQEQAVRKAVIDHPNTSTALLQQMTWRDTELSSLAQAKLLSRRITG